MAAAPAVSTTPENGYGRWSAHRGHALAVRAIVYLAPIVASIVFVHYAGQVVPAPVSSLWLYLLWWFGLSLAATVVLIGIDRVTRRLLPLAALLQLSLVFPDEAPSRFKIAFRAGDVDRLEARLEKREALAAAPTPSEAANRLLELVAALNIHDPLTRGHCDRVRAYSVMIGEELGLRGDELDLLNWAALLHDVGKLDVPTEILSKDGRPTDAEWEVLRLHPVYGEEMIEPLQEWLGRWTSAVGYHHERWDGTGYPYALAGEDIPLPGRIVAVADVFDVITSVRSYKKASHAEEGRTEIARCAGTQFDPDVVRAFLNVSLGRMRFVMGPLSWLAHAPMLGRLPFTPALGTAAGVLGVAATSAVAGLVPPPPTATAAGRTEAPPARVAPAPHPRAARAASPSPHRVVVRHTPVVAGIHGSTAAPRPSAAPAAAPAGASAPATPPSDPPSTPVTDHPAPAPAVGPPPPPPVPRFTSGGDVSVAEDSPTASLPWATDIDAGAVGTGVTFATTAYASDLFAVQPAVSPAGVLSFTPAKDAYGETTVVSTAGSPSGLSAPHSFRLRILPVNDPPAFAGGGDVTAVEGAGPTSISWASQISPGPANEGGQHVTFTAAAKDTSLFASGGQPVVGDDGTLTFTPASFAHGTTTVQVTAIDDGGTANGGVDRTSTTFSLVVLPRNHGPVISGIGSVTVLEDAGPQTVQWVTSSSPGAPDESAQSVKLAVTNDHPELFAIQPALSQSGVLTFTPAADAHGAATVAVTASDDGGTANDGVDTTTVKFTLSIKPVDDAPTFSGGGSVSTDEDAAVSGVQWATAIAPGPADEAGQHVTFTVTNDRNSLFSVQPSIDGSGKLSYTPAPNANGAAAVTVVAHDDGGTANGGVDQSAPVTFTLTVEPVNDAPAFAAADATSLEDASVAGAAWATGISPGPADESAQHVTFAITGDSNPSLFSVPPSIDAAGNLSYTPAPDANGSATITAVAHDDGGTWRGGVDQSPPFAFTITVAPVDDAPTIAPITTQTVTENDGPQSSSVTTLGRGPANESSQSLTVTTSVDHPEYFDAAGQPTVDTAGTLSFTPAAGAFGTATVTVTVTDDGGTAGGGVDQAATTFTIAIAQLPPTAGADAYATTLLSPLVVDAGHGVLANDGDVNSSTLTVTPQTTTSAVLGGTLTLAADGSFTYAPGPLSGIDTFTYTITDGDGQTATGTVTFDVSLLAPTSGTLYLGTGGSSSEVLSLDAAAPASVAPVPDLDGDGHPGLTIEGSDGKQTINEPKKQEAWAFETGGAALVLSGPMTLNLTAATQNLDTNKSERVWLYVYDCPGGSSTLATTGCTLIGQNQVLFSKWNTAAAYETHSVVVPVNATVAAGRQLRIRILIGGAALWIPLVGPTTSSLDYTG